MLEKPGLHEEKIIACLWDEYGLPVTRVTFLPLGVDSNTAVYRAVVEDRTPYFVKLRKGSFGEIIVTLPRFLRDQGIAQIIAPLATRTGLLWGELESYKLILYPFVEGSNGYEVGLSERHWGELGQALKRIHTLSVPPALLRRISRETFTPYWREMLEQILARLDEQAFDDPVAVKLADFLKAKRSEVFDLVRRAERLAGRLRARPAEFVLCHADIHAGNILIGADDALYIVDWDDPILAPKERDLMFIGGGLMGNTSTPQEEERLFYRGYGPTQVDPTTLVYYRYERIIQDIVVFCKEIQSSTDGGEDRKQALRYLMSNFLLNGTIEIARRSDRTSEDHS
jgi:spectinomycin phosphotransferase